jgi:hypothetical protein
MTRAVPTSKPSLRNTITLLMVNSHVLLPLPRSNRYIRLASIPATLPSGHKRRRPAGDGSCKRRRSEDLGANAGIDAATIIDLFAFAFEPSAYSALATCDPTSQTAWMEVRVLHQELTPVLGARPDTQCPNCLLWGHDQRYTRCPVKVVREGLRRQPVEIDMESLEFIIRSRNFWLGLPENFRMHQKALTTIVAVCNEVNMCLPVPMGLRPQEEDQATDQDYELQQGDDQQSRIGQDHGDNQNWDQQAQGESQQNRAQQAEHTHENMNSLEHPAIEQLTYNGAQKQSQPSQVQLGKIDMATMDCSLLQEALPYTIASGDDLFYDHRIAPIAISIKVMPFVRV